MSVYCWVSGANAVPSDAMSLVFWVLHKTMAQLSLNAGPVHDAGVFSVRSIITNGDEMMAQLCLHVGPVS